MKNKGGRHKTKKKIPKQQKVALKQEKTTKKQQRNTFNDNIRSFKGKKGEQKYKNKPIIITNEEIRTAKKQKTRYQTAYDLKGTLIISYWFTYKKGNYSIYGTATSQNIYKNLTSLINQAYLNAYYKFKSRAGIIGTPKPSSFSVKVKNYEIIYYQQVTKHTKQQRNIKKQIKQQT